MAAAIDLTEEDDDPTHMNAKNGKFARVGGRDEGITIVVYRGKTGRSRSSSKFVELIWYTTRDGTGREHPCWVTGVSTPNKTVWVQLYDRATRKIPGIVAEVRLGDLEPYESPALRRRIRTKQDAAYEEALRKDREKEAVEKTGRSQETGKRKRSNPAKAVVPVASAVESEDDSADDSAPLTREELRAARVAYFSAHLNKSQKKLKLSVSSAEGPSEAPSEAPLAGPAEGPANSKKRPAAVDFVATNSNHKKRKKVPRKAGHQEEEEDDSDDNGSDDEEDNKTQMCCCHCMAGGCTIGCDGANPAMPEDCCYDTCFIAFPVCEDCYNVCCN